MEQYGTIKIKLNDLLKESGLSKNKLSHRAEMQRTQINHYCNNEVTRLDTDVLARICTVFAEIEKDAKFCKNCGAKQEEPKQEPEILEVQVVETVEVTKQQNEISQENNGDKDNQVENKGEKDIKNNLEETVAVESDVEVDRENTEKESENLEKTVEIESNVNLEQEKEDKKENQN